MASISSLGRVVCIPLRSLCLLLLCSVAANLLTPLHAEDVGFQPVGRFGAIEQYLLDRLKKDPGHAESWRALGRVRQQQGDINSAVECVSHALRIEPTSIAANFDMGVLAEQQGNAELALQYFKNVLLFGDQTEYAPQVIARGITLTHEKPSEENSSSETVSTGEYVADFDSIEIQQASLQVRTFDGADELDETVDRIVADSNASLQRWRAFVEAGLVYNSNVTLTPISQELLNSDAGGFQAIFNPDVEWIAAYGDSWRGGPLFRGLFNVNESHLSQFNLNSFQPGLFVEVDDIRSDHGSLARLEYVVAMDHFERKRIGTRHTLQSSWTALRADQRMEFYYFSASVADFEDDGINPSETSLDGWTLTGGYSRFWETGWRLAPRASCGLDLEHTDTTGSDFQYMGLTGHGSLTFQLGAHWEWIQSGGLGYRDYYQFTGPVSRDELLWRASSTLQQNWTERWSTSIFYRYDRFASENEDFDADRTETGGAVSFLF